MRAALGRLAHRLNFRWGITRLVWLVGPYAIKLPNPFNGWGNFIGGIQANICERNNWGAAVCGMEPDDPRLAIRELLCPLSWTSWGCWVVVMRRCTRTLTRDEWDALDLAPWEAQDLDGDDKAFNYGWLDGRIVKLDYGHFMFLVRWWKVSAPLSSSHGISLQTPAHHSGSSPCSCPAGRCPLAH